MTDASEAVERVLSGERSDAFHFGEQAPQHARLLRALRSESARGTLSPPDFSVLLRGAIREASLLSGRNGLRIPAVRSPQDVLLKHGLRASEIDDTRVHVRAAPWDPEWLGHSEGTSLEAQLFSRELVVHEPSVDPDPVLLRLGYTNYSSEAQREAVRTVLSASPGSTVAVLLPTGAGKTLCGLLPACLPLQFGNHVEADRFGVTPVIVPTVSLALDLQRRVTNSGFVAHATAYRPGTDDAEAIRTRIRSGTQGPVFAAPESIVGGLRESLLAAARQGFLRFMVVDEAHIVASWGDEFRPAFQQLATACRELRAATTIPFVLVLMSATVTAYGLETLEDLFAAEGGFHVVHAARLRPEPRYAWRKASTADERRYWVLDALAHLPRPAILYTTRRADAISWRRELWNAGYRRLGLIHGASTDAEREQVLEDWSADSIDLVIATSAFGLGVDKSDVRVVLHATYPESLDRYYQEVGRGGRDGRPSLSLMVWTDRDVLGARKLARPKFIGIGRGSERWQAMFTSGERRDLGEGAFEVPTHVSPSTRSEDIDMRGEANERWNQRTLLLLQRAGAITLLNGGDLDQRDPERSFVRLRILEDRHLDDAFWEERILPRRRELLASYSRDWDLMGRAVSGAECLSFVLQEQYTAAAMHVDVVRACSSCPHCRASGTRPTVGPLRARHTPPVPEPSRVPTRPEAFEILKLDAEIGFIFVQPAEEAPERLVALADWLAGHGLSDFVLPPSFARPWGPHFAHSDLPRVFFHSERVRGIRRQHPVAVFLPAAGIPSLEAGGILIVSADCRQPGRPDRRMLDVVNPGARWTLTQFMDRYME